jgi:casein kinase II subunit beta
MASANAIDSSDLELSSGDDSDSSSEYPSWIHWFASTQGSSLLCEVDATYIEDQFNIYGLKSHIEDGYYQKALDNILDRKECWVDTPEVAKASNLLYGLSHARYIVTVAGLSKMVSRRGRKKEKIRKQKK